MASADSVGENLQRAEIALREALAQPTPSAWLEALSALFQSWPNAERDVLDLVVAGALAFRR